MYKIELYEKQNGKVPVEDFLKSLHVKTQAKALRDIDLLGKYGNNLHEPYVKYLKGNDCKNLYELRIKFSHDNCRIFYFTHVNNNYVLLHGFLKKTMKTPQKELNKAISYMEDYKRRHPL